MNSQNIMQQVVREVESLTGCPVQVQQDASLQRMSSLDMARGTLRLHRICINPVYRPEAAYLAVFQCGFILRRFALPPEQRFDFTANPEGRKESDRLVQAHYADQRLPPHILRGLGDQLFDGLMRQLISIPLSLRVDSWIADTYAALHSQQEAAITRQLQEALPTLSPDVKKVAPEKIVSASLGMNAALAGYWSRRWDDPLLFMPYRAARVSQQGDRLLEILDGTPVDPGHDKTLVSAWASELGVGDWIDWIPYELDEG